MIKKTLCAGALALGLLSSSCLGPNNAQNSINNWSARATEQDWLNEIIFLVTSPVQALAWTGDVLIFNTVEYWSGDNWVSDPGPFPDTFGKGGDDG